MYFHVEPIKLLDIGKPPCELQVAVVDEAGGDLVDCQHGDQHHAGDGREARDAEQLQDVDDQHDHHQHDDDLLDRGVGHEPRAGQAVGGRPAVLEVDQVLGRVVQVRVRDPIGERRHRAQGVKRQR
mgnify:CR=1 FL=1